MKLRNTSKYRTDDLRAWILGAFKNQGVRSRGVSVVVTEAIQFGLRGRAALGRQIQAKSADGLTRTVGVRQGLWMLLRIPSDLSSFSSEEHFRACVAWLIMHEAQHLKGIEHTEMSDAMRHTRDQALPEWAQGLALRLKQEPAKLTREQVQQLAAQARRAKAEADETHARRMFASSVRRLQSANRAYKKWERKVRYYDHKHDQQRTAACTATSKEGSHA